MTELQQAKQEAAAAPPQVVTLGGRTFIVPIPGLSDFFAQRAEARRQVQESSSDPLELLNKRISEAERRNKPFSPTLINALTAEALKAGTSKDAKTEPTESQLMEQVTRPEMVRWWAWHLIRKADASVTLNDIAEWTPTDDSVYELSAKLGKLMKLAELDPN